MNLHTLTPASGSTKISKRIGRGQGSGKGGTSTKGHKGAQARTGYKFRAWFEGGQMPLYRRIPKFGFKNNARIEFIPLNLDMVAEFLNSHPGTTEIDHAFLALHGFISKGTERVKLLGRGEIKTAVTVKLNKFSKSAKAAIEAAGGTAIEV
ncbi:MAG: ribosomal protein [Bacteroidota bacterium]|jgi:large subunit ribosomal protein L15